MGTQNTPRPSVKCSRPPFFLPSNLSVNVFSEPEAEHQAGQSEKLHVREDLCAEEKPAERPQRRLHPGDAGPVQGAELRGHLLQHR